jgi:hypothetical protein
MTEEQNPHTAKTGIFLFLGKRIHQRRAFHIPTAPATATLSQNPNPKGAFLPHPLSPSSGSSFDWKRLKNPRMFLIPCSCGASFAVSEDYDRKGMHLRSFIPCPNCGKRHDPRNRLLTLSK